MTHAHPCATAASAGLLPILKELVEILFQEGLIKVGTATCVCTF
jgi:superfamily II RNA helicase